MQVQVMLLLGLSAASIALHGTDDDTPTDKKGLNASGKQPAMRMFV